jgi:hypothetical protein
MKNNMAAEESFSLAFVLIAVSNEPVELEI